MTSVLLVAYIFHQNYCGCCVFREHSHKQEDQYAAQHVRLQADAAKRHAHRTNVEQQWQEDGFKWYGQQDIPCKWPPIAGPPGAHQHASPCGKAAVVDAYFRQLETLQHRVYTCPRCLQRTPHHGTPAGCKHSISGEDSFCRNCQQYPDGYQSILAGELDMDPARESDPAQQAAKLQWLELLQSHGPLLPMEECLLSPVLCFVKVCPRPGVVLQFTKFCQVVTLSGGQLGYRQSVINFMSDNINTVHKLPRLPSQVKVLVYDKLDKEGQAHALHVRKGAVVAYLRFFMAHNPLYRGAAEAGIPSVEEEAGHWQYVPDDGPLEGVHVEHAEDGGMQGDSNDASQVDITCDENSGAQADSELAISQWTTAMGGFWPMNCVHDWAVCRFAGSIHVNGITLIKWLGCNSAMAKEAALSIKSQLRLDVTDWRHEEPIINYLHGKTAGDGRMATLNCKALSNQLAQLLDLKSLSVAEERQLLHELQPHFANSSEHTFAFDSMMRGTRSNDAVEHTHQILEEHLGAPVAVGPALKDSGGVAVSGLAFPSLFPLGIGHFEHPRARSMEWYQWARVLVNFYDGRFAIHSTFPYFLLNTLHRQQSFDNASLFMQRDNRFDRKTWAQLEKLAQRDKVHTFKKVSAAASNMQNSDGYWQKQKVSSAFCIALS